MKAALPPRKQKKPRPEPENETWAIYVPRRLWARLGASAAANQRSVSELVVGILQRRLERHERERRR